VNGQQYDPTGSIANPAMGTIERWTFTSDFNHPVHLHLGHFQVVSVDGKTVNAAERGWKDTVNVTPFAVVEVLVRSRPTAAGTCCTATTSSTRTW